jgi:hypothetical protein
MIFRLADCFVQSTEESLFDSIRKESKSIDKLLNARGLLVQKKEKCIRNIRELGSIPSNSLQK